MATATASRAFRAAPGKNGQERPAELRVKRILIVDDSSLMRAIIRTMLLGDKSTSWEVAEAASGPDLLEAVAGKGPFDIILLDVQMPGMDGFAACRRLRELNGQVPVVFLTAEGDRASFDRGRTSGGDSYLVKPFSPMALKATLHMLTDLKRSAEGNCGPGPLVGPEALAASEGPLAPSAR